MGTSSGIRRWLSSVAILGLVAAACGGGSVPSDPTEALVDAVDRTSSGSFAFDVQVEMDETASGQMPSDELPVAALLGSVEVTGHTDGDEAVQLTVAAMGQELFQLRQTDATHLYLRTDAGRIAEAFGVPFDRDQLLADSQQAPPAVRELAAGLLDGRWVGIVGEPAGLPTEDMVLMGGIDPSEIEAAQREAFGGSPGEFAERFLSAEPADGDTRDEGELAVSLHTRAVAEAMRRSMSEVFGDDDASEDEDAELERVPETVGGITVTVSDRLIRRATVDLFELARSLDPDAGDRPAGSLRLVAELSEHGRADPVAAPEDVLEVAGEDLGHFHPGRLLPLPGLGSLTWPLGMLFMPMGVTSVERSVESSVEVELSPELEVTTEVAPTSAPTAYHPSPAEPEVVETSPSN